MLTYLNKAFFVIALGIFCLTTTGELQAASREVSSYIAKTYTKKAPYAGYGEKSAVNGMPKTKIINGHLKRTEVVGLGWTGFDES